MPIHVAQQGDCITNIADRYGLTWQKIWNRPENSEIKSQRKDPNVLYPGDSIFVPELEPRVETRATDKSHKFVKKGTPAKLDLRLMIEDKPRAGVPYRLEIDGMVKSGTTDGGGHVKETLPPGAQHGKLYVGTGATQDVYELEFGAVDPIDTPEGFAGRLKDLGYGTDDMPEAIRAFQKKKNLEITGEVNDATRDALKSEFGQ